LCHVLEEDSADHVLVLRVFGVDLGDDCFTGRQETLSNRVLADVLLIVELFSFQANVVSAHFTDLDHLQEEKGRWCAVEPLVE